MEDLGAFLTLLICAGIVVLGTLAIASDCYGGRARMTHERADKLCKTHQYAEARMLDNWPYCVRTVNGVVEMVALEGAIRP